MSLLDHSVVHTVRAQKLHVDNSHLGGIRNRGGIKKERKEDKDCFSAVLVDH